MVFRTLHFTLEILCKTIPGVWQSEELTEILFGSMSIEIVIFSLGHVGATFGGQVSTPLMIIMITFGVVLVLAILISTCADDAVL